MASNIHIEDFSFSKSGEFESFFSPQNILCTCQNSKPNCLQIIVKLPPLPPFPPKSVCICCHDVTISIHRPIVCGFVVFKTMGASPIGEKKKPPSKIW